MKTLVVGATGATGRLLVAQLLERGQNVNAIVRSPDKLSKTLRQHKNLFLTHSSPLDLSEAELVQHVRGCDAVASCLGHHMTLGGIYGHPRRLVTETVRRFCNAIKMSTPAKPVKFILMNTAGNSNRDLAEPVSQGQKVVITLLRHLLPPHADNEEAADHLRTEVGQNDKATEWVAVRPDGLTDEEGVTDYELYASPTRSAIFNAGQTSRINVAHFMADLITDETVWRQWKGQMPVIYNKGAA